MEEKILIPEIERGINYVSLCVCVFGVCELGERGMLLWRPELKVRCLPDIITLSLTVLGVL